MYARRNEHENDGETSPLFSSMLIEDTDEAFGACQNCPAIRAGILQAAGFRGLAHKLIEQSAAARIRIRDGTASDLDVWFVKEADREAAESQASAELIMNGVALYRRNCPRPLEIRQRVDGEEVGSRYVCQSPAPFTIASPEAEE